MFEPGAARPLAVLVLGLVVLVAGAAPPMPAGGGGALVIVGAIAAWATRSTLFLAAVRRGRVSVVPSGRVHHLGRLAARAAVLSAAAALPLILTPPDHVRGALLAAGALGITLAAALDRRDRAPRMPRSTSRAAWLVADTALPAGALAAALGVCVATLNLHARAPVQPETLARHMAGSTFVYALLLGLGGFSKAWTEQRSGLVRVAPTSARVPGPIVTGLALGVGELFLVPVLVGPLPLESVLALKAMVGFCVGGGLCLLGALRGARAASGGRP